MGHQHSANARTAFFCCKTRLYKFAVEEHRQHLYELGAPIISRRQRCFVEGKTTSRARPSRIQLCCCCCQLHYTPILHASDSECTARFGMITHTHALVTFTSMLQNCNFNCDAGPPCTNSGAKVEHTFTNECRKLQFTNPWVGKNNLQLVTQSSSLEKRLG